MIRAFRAHCQVETLRVSLVPAPDAAKRTCRIDTAWCARAPRRRILQAHLYSTAVAADSADRSKACVAMPSEVTTVGSEQSVEELRRQLAEALETQTATAAILRVIASSRGDLTPVLSAVAESAARLCDAFDALVLLRKGDELHTLAHHGPIPARPGGPIARDWVIGRAFLDRTPVQVADLTTAGADFPRGQAMAVRDGFRTSLAIPLQRQKGEPVGAICVRRTEVRPFTEKQIGLLQTFADQAVIAIENSRLFEAEQTRTRELSERTQELTAALEYQTATSDVLAVISRSKFDLQPVMDTLVQAAGRLCDADAWLFRRQGNAYGWAASYGFSVEQHERIKAYFIEKTFVPDPRGMTSMRAAFEGRPVHILDVLADPEYTHTEAQKVGGFRTTLGVPLLRDGVVMGVLALTRSEVRPFTDKQIELITTFADQAVIAIENSRLVEAEQASKREVQESVEQQTATGEILASISTSMADPQPVFDAILRNASRLLGTQRCNVVLLRDGILHMPAAAGELLPRRFPRPLDHTTAAGQAILTKQVVQYSPVLGEGSVAPSATQGLAREFGYDSVLVAPMVHKDKVIGAIGAARREPKAFDDKQVALIKAFADQAVIAIENARLFGEVQARNCDLTALREVGRAVSSTLDFKVVLKTIVERAVELSETDAGYFYYLEEIGRFALSESTGVVEE